jgi:type I restriction-modification system DNA methylase subunit
VGDLVSETPEPKQTGIGAYYTPDELLGLRPIDPACGTGGFLADIVSNPPWGEA